MLKFLGRTDPEATLGLKRNEILLSVIFLYFAFKCGLWVVNFRRRWLLWSQIPHAADGHWLVGHALHLARSQMPWHVLINWLEANGGPIVRFRILGNLAVILNDPDAMKQVFHSKMKAYPKDTAFSYGPFLSILGTGLVTADGAHWQKQRLLIGPAMKFDALEKVIPISLNALQRLQTKLANLKSRNAKVDMANEFRHVTLQVIGDAVLSLSPEECDNVLAKHYLPIMEECDRRVIHRWRCYLPVPSWFQHCRRLHILNSFIKRILRKRWQEKRQGDKPIDLLDKMILSLKDQGEIWNLALENQLCYEIKTFLLAGHETSAAMLAWSLYELLKEPEYLKNVQREADKLFPHKDYIPKRQDVEEMEFTLCVLKEALRKYTVVPAVSRVSTLDEDELCNYKIPKDTMVVLSLKGVHAKYRDSTKFFPERFLPNNEYDSFPEDIRQFMFLPFIQGPRNCLGQYFSLLEARLVLAYVVKYYDFTLLHDEVIEPSDVIPEAPKHGLNVLLAEKA